MTIYQFVAVSLLVAVAGWVLSVAAIVALKIRDENDLLDLILALIALALSVISKIAIFAFMVSGAIAIVKLLWYLK